MKKLLGRWNGITLLAFAWGLLFGAAGESKATTYYLTSGFSLTNNPSGPWSYGYEQTLGTNFTFYTNTFSLLTPNNVPVSFWGLYSNSSGIYFNSTTQTAVANFEQSAFAPAAIWFTPGTAGKVDNYSIIRFTLPAGLGGNFNVAVTALPGLGNSTGFSEFSLLLNGTNIYSQQLWTSAALVTNNILSLTAGDTLDFSIGRGLNGLNDGTVLILLATISQSTPTGDLSEDFSTVANPNGPWTYGSVTNVGYSPFTPFYSSALPITTNGDVLLEWTYLGSNSPAIYHNGNTNTVNYNGGEFAADATWLTPGESPIVSLTDVLTTNSGVVTTNLTYVTNEVSQFGDVRFTVPVSGPYALSSTVQPYLTNSLGSDSDFHILVNSNEIFAQVFTPGTSGYYSSTNFSTNYNFQAGDMVDFVVGPGTDGLAGSGVILEAIVSPPFTLNFTNDAVYFTNTETIAIYVQPTNAAIYFTLDGSLPNLSSTNTIFYTNIITLTNTTIVTAQAFYTNAFNLLVPGSLVTNLGFANTNLIPFVWLTNYFSTNYATNLAAAFTADPDGDGATNYLEYIDGTDPTNAASIFKFLGISFSAAGGSTNGQGTAFLGWNTSLSNQYLLQRRYADATNWINVATNTAAANGSTNYADTTAVATNPAIYRLILLNPNH